MDINIEMMKDLLSYYAEELYLYKPINPRKSNYIKSKINEIYKALKDSGHDCNRILSQIDSKIDLMYQDEPIYAYVDGAARGSHDKSIENKAAVAVIIYDDCKEVYKDFHMIESCSSVEAEYKALIKSLRQMLIMGYRKRYVTVYSDYKPVVKQLKMIYKASNPKLVALRDEARSLLERFSFINVKHISRKDNVCADMLVNKALDNQIIKEGLKVG